MGDSEVVGGAKTTAVAEIVDIEDNVPTGMDPGILGAAGFDFCCALRRTGANAREADHPLDSRTHG